MPISTQVPVRRLGRFETGLPVLSFGAAPLMSRCDRRTSLSAIAKAVEMGINHFDTAPLYGQGDSERLLGEYFAGRRESVIITTKCGQTAGRGVSNQASRTLKAMIRPIVRRFRSVRQLAGRVMAAQTKRNDVAPNQIRNSVEGSLQRLQTDYIDILLLHSVSAEALATDGVFDTLRMLLQEGKIRHYGVSCNDARQALDATGRDPQLHVVQFPVSIGSENDTSEILTTLGQRGIGIIARAPFHNARLFQEQPASGEPARSRVARLAEVCRNRDIPLPAGALRWAIDQPFVTTVLTSMTSVCHIVDNAAAAALPELTLLEQRRLASRDSVTVLAE